LSGTLSGTLSGHRAVTALCVALLTTAASCGIPLDDTARASTVDIPTPVARKDPTPQGESQALLFVTREDLMVAVERDIADRRPSTILSGLLAELSPTEQAAGFVSQIPAGTKLLSVRRTDEGFNVDLSAPFAEVVGTSRQRAVAQIMFSIADVDDASQFRFAVDGSPVLISTPKRGDTDIVSTCDFADLLSTDDEINTSGLTATVQRRLSAVRRLTFAKCPAQGAPANSE